MGPTANSTNMDIELSDIKFDPSRITKQNEGSDIKFHIVSSKGRSNDIVAPFKGEVSINKKDIEGMFSLVSDKVSY